MFGFIGSQGLPSHRQIHNFVESGQDNSRTQLYYSKELFAAPGSYSSLHLSDQSCKIMPPLLSGLVQEDDLFLNNSLDKQVTVSLQVKNSLDWWKDQCSVCAGVPFVYAAPTITVARNTLLLRWGAHLSRLITQDRWSA